MPPDQLKEPDSPQAQTVAWVLPPEDARPATVARRAPMLWLLAAILAGYILADGWPGASVRLLAGLALLFAAVATGCAFLAPQKEFPRSKWARAWGVLFLLAGTLLAWAWHEVRAPAPPDEWAQLPPREATLTLSITRPFAPKSDTNYASGLAEITAAPAPFAQLVGRSIQYRVRAETGYGEAPPVRGEVVEITGLLGYLPELSADADPHATEEQKLATANSARFRRYLHAEGAWFELARGRFVREVEPPTAWQQWLTRQHIKIENLLRNGPAVWKEKYGNTYVALLLGEPALLDSGQRDAFTTSGEVYLFALSGLHVGILAAALWWLLRRVPRLPHAAGELITLAAAWLYVEIAGGTTSGRRVAVILTLYLLAWWFGRARSPLAAFAAAGVGVLVLDPWALNQSGFELSFGVVLGLILYAMPLRQALEENWTPWRDIPAESHAPWQKCLGWLWRRLADMSATSWTAVLCSSPLTAQFFGFFSAHVLALNLFFFPLTCVALWSGTMAVALGMIGFPPFTWMAWLANGAGLAAVGWMEALANRAPAWGWLFMRLQISPAWAGSMATLVILAAMLLAQPKERAPRWWYFALPVAILALFAAACARPA